MGIFISLSTFALRQVVDGACAAIGISESGEAVVGFMADRFTDHSQRLNKALQKANENAWKALEIALAGDSLWERCKATVTKAEDKAFAQQVRAFLDVTPFPELSGKAAFRQKCLEELRAARKGKALTAGTLDPHQLAQGTADFARFSDPQSLLDTEWRMVVGLASQVKEAGFPSLAWLLSQRPQEGMPILVVGVRYFFRRAVEEDQKLFQGLSFARLEALGEAQERGFTALSVALSQQGRRLEELLGDVKAVVVQTHSAVLDLQGQMKGHGEQIEQIGQAVQKLLEQHQLQRRELRPADSMSIRNEGERQLVKQLVARYRSLPEGERRRLPALLNAVGKLEVVSGDFDAAQKDFQTVATLVDDTKAKAEAHFNAYQTALERRDFDTAMKEFIEAVKLDAKRYAPFPVGKYHPLRILGAGGFGTAFLCRHKYMDAQVVVKTLHLDDLGQNTDNVFTEAQALRQLDHPAIIRISECGYVDASSKGRPHIIMDYFQGHTLEGYVKEYGPFSVEDLLLVARQVAEGLQAAHGAKILHRDVKPANLLVRKEATGWKVKIIDFGLAMPQKVAETSQKASTAKQKETMIGSSIAGTLDYGAPEQMGKRKEPVGPYSDVYGWAKTCCYALFQTPQPLMKHWKSVPAPLAELLEKCLDEDPKQRPAGFAEVLKCLTLRGSSVATATPATKGPEQGFDFGSAAVTAPERTITRKKPNRSRLPWVLGGVGLLAMGLIVVFGFMLGRQKKEGPEMAEVNPGKPGTKGPGELVKSKPATLPLVTEPAENTPTKEEKQKVQAQLSWKRIAGTYVTDEPDHKQLGELVLDIGPSDTPLLFRVKGGVKGMGTHRLKQVGKTWLFDWGNIDLFAISPQENDTVIMSVYWKECSKCFDQGIVPNRTPDRTTVFVRKGKHRDDDPIGPVRQPTSEVMKAIQGEWLCTGMEEIGIVYDKKAIDQQDRRVTIKGNSYSMIRTKDGMRASHVGTFVIDASNGHFDFTGMGEEWVGIYELDGDTLKVCYRYKRNADCVRPTEFKTDTARPNISVFYLFKQVTK